MTSEIGGENGLLPLFVAAFAGIPVLDADPRGRAFPEMQMSSFAIGGLPLFPVAVADIRNNEAIILRTQKRQMDGADRTADLHRGGRAASNLSPTENAATDPGARVAWFSQPRDSSRCSSPGSASDRPCRSGRNVLAVEAGIELFRGKVIDVERRTTAGFVRGHALIDGVRPYSGQTFKVDFQNEFTIGWIDERLVAMVPDLLCILDDLPEKRSERKRSATASA